MREGHAFNIDLVYMREGHAFNIDLCI